MDNLNSYSGGVFRWFVCTKVVKNQSLSEVVMQGVQVDLCLHCTLLGCIMYPQLLRGRSNPLAL